MAGKAIAYFPDLMVERDIAEGRLVRVLPDCRFPTAKGKMFLLYPAMTFVPPKVRAFSDFIAKAVSTRAP